MPKEWYWTHVRLCCLSLQFSHPLVSIKHCHQSRGWSWFALVFGWLGGELALPPVTRFSKTLHCAKFLDSSQFYRSPPPHCKTIWIPKRGHSDFGLSAGNNLELEKITSRCSKQEKVSRWSCSAWKSGSFAFECAVLRVCVRDTRVFTLIELK